LWWLIIAIPVLFIILVEAGRARGWLIDVEEEGEDRKKIIPEGKQTA